MAVHFVYRCPYVGPTGRHVVHFPDDSVLDWFRRVWSRLVVPSNPDCAADRLAELLGVHVYDFWLFFENSAEDDLPPPASETQLRDYLENHLGPEGMVHARPHAIQVLTDDDDVMLAYFLFDDHFVAKHPDRVAFLLTEAWQLPGGSSDEGFTPAVRSEQLLPRGNGEGTTYMVLLGIYSCDHLDGMAEGFHIPGVRLPDLVRHVLPQKPDNDWPCELTWTHERLLLDPPALDAQERAFVEALREWPNDTVTWMAYSDWLAERGQPSAGITLLRRALERVASDGVWKGSNHDPTLSCIHAGEHLAILCLHVASHTYSTGKVQHHYHQWYFFDDLWAAAHPALANSLLAYGRRWDALSGWKARVLEPE